MAKKEINDFGEKIGGARKDLYSTGISMDDIANFNHRELLKNCTKKNVWQKPNYEDMVSQNISKEVVYFYKLIYDSFPTKISTTGVFEKDKEIAKNYVELGKLISDIDIKTYDDFKRIEDIFYSYGYLEKTNSRYYSYTNKSYKIDLSKIMSKINDSRREYERGKARRKIEEINFPYKQEAYKKGVIIKEYGEANKEYRVCKKSGGYYRALGTFTSKEKAEYFVNNTLKEYYDKKKNKENKIISPRPQLQNIRRRGIDYRQNKDVDTGLFQKTFDFRGGEFGNWNTKEDRQQNLNLAFDSLIDLSKVLKISPKSISLDKSLAIAFGSRGRGKANAHYEPSSVVINLTKMRGAGSLAHEWGHALDDYLGRKSGNVGINSLLTDKLKIKDSKIPEEVTIIKSLMDKIKYRTLNQDEIIKKNKKELIKVKTVFAEKQIWSIVAKEIGNKKDFFEKYDYFLNPKNSYKKYESNFDKFIDEVSKQLGHAFCDEDKKNYLKIVIEDFKRREENVENTKGLIGHIKEETTFLKNARKLDEFSSKPYFTENKELFARAFETYIEKKLRENGLQSDYLVYGTLDGSIMYPNEKEQEILSQEFDRLFDEISVLDKDNTINDNFSISDVTYENKEFNVEKDIEKDVEKEQDKQANEQTKYRYYLTNRPPSIGTHPRDNCINVVGYDDIKNINGIEAWGYVEYAMPLPQSVLDDYELIDIESINIEDIEDIGDIGDIEIKLEDDKKILDIAEYEKYIDKLIEQEQQDKKDLVEVFKEADSFRFERFYNEDKNNKSIAIVVPSFSSDKQYKVIFGTDKGEGIELLSHSHLNREELAERLMEGGFRAENIEEKLKIEDLNILDNKEPIDIKFLVEYQELKKQGDIVVIRLNNNDLDKLQKFDFGYSKTQEKNTVKLLVLKKDKIKALEILGRRDKQIGGIVYEKMKEDPKAKQYIDISTKEFEKIKDMNIKYSAFLKKNNRINLVIFREDSPKVLEQIERKFEKTLGNIKYDELKINEVVYKQFEKKLAIKIIEKMLDKGLEVSALPYGQKVNMAFKKKDIPQVQAIYKCIINREKER